MSIRPEINKIIRASALGGQLGNFLLAVEVSDGQFDSEAIVSFNNASGHPISAIASRSLLQKNSCGHESLRVRLIANKGSFQLVEVPGDLFGATRDVLVANEILEEIAAAG